MYQYDKKVITETNFNLNLSNGLFKQYVYLNDKNCILLNEILYNAWKAKKWKLTELSEVLDT